MQCIIVHSFRDNITAMSNIIHLQIFNTNRWMRNGRRTRQPKIQEGYVLWKHYYYSGEMVILCIESTVQQTIDLTVSKIVINIKHNCNEINNVFFLQFNEGVNWRSKFFLELFFFCVILNKTTIMRASYLPYEFQWIIKKFIIRIKTSTGVQFIFQYFAEFAKSSILWHLVQKNITIIPLKSPS